MQCQTEACLKIYHALLEGGPCTTLELAARSNISPFTVRPRVSDLCRAGLVKMVERQHRGRIAEGCYAAVPAADFVPRETKHKPMQMALL